MKDTEHYGVGSPPPIEAYKDTIIHMIQAERAHVVDLLERIQRYIVRVDENDFRNEDEKKLIRTDLDKRMAKYINAVR